VFGSLYNLPDASHCIERIWLVQYGLFDIELIRGCYHTGRILGYENNNCECGRMTGIAGIGGFLF